MAPFVQGDRPSASLPDLSLVIPTYRQARVIGAQVGELLAALDSLDIRYELRVVIDGDLDGTEAELRRITHDSLYLVILAQNAGKGSAVRRGLLASSGKARAFLDGGGDIPSRCLVDAYRRFQDEQCDIIVGSKLHPESIVDYPLMRRIYSWGYRQVTRLLFGLNVRDTQVGLKVYTSTVVEQVFPHVRTDGFAFDIEALALASRLGFRNIGESPVVIRDQYPSTIRLTTVVTMLIETVQVWWRVRRFGPDRSGSYRTRRG